MRVTEIRHTWRNHHLSLDVDFLLMELLTRSRADLHCHAEKSLTNEQQQQLQQWLKRRIDGEPLAYLVAHQPFWNLDLKVTPDTLIPRPETESLVEWVLTTFAAQRTLRILDAGTGSGAIALALAKEKPDWRVDASDISVAALAVAKKNAAIHHVNNVTFYRGSWLNAVPVTARYDVIISNPPYVRDSDPHLTDLRYEPQQALIAKENGLADLCSITESARLHLIPQGVIVLEHGYDQQPAVIKLLSQTGYTDIMAHCDMGQQPRFVTAIFP